MNYYGDPNSPYYTKRIIDYCETELGFDFYLCNLVKYILRHKKKHNDLEFNRVLWHGLKGNQPYPGPRRAAFILPKTEDPD